MKVSSQGDLLDELPGGTAGPQGAGTCPDHSGSYRHQRRGEWPACTSVLADALDSIRQITRFGEYDSRPEAGHIPFRVTFTVSNGTDKPYDLDDLSATAEGGTTGGQPESLYVTVGSCDRGRPEH
ncbi:hypothetical protein [Streptomyces swartbergensis]|uniref:Uncharacterized protein n=1 Tax=Streptomyces swartbergensis TaxID=487165 RepID=A0A243S9B9_9ACTN|nr:hypothetical protein [Streptomyces swartbergensis]OUD04249.1 hypothetical protein CA983_05005 [Streptomyces swartbergensis]